jgi:hypothetical protein
MLLIFLFARFWWRAKKEKRIGISGTTSPGRKTPALLKQYQEEMVEHG